MMHGGCLTVTGPDGQPEVSRRGGGRAAEAARGAAVAPDSAGQGPGDCVEQTEGGDGAALCTAALRPAVTHKGCWLVGGTGWVHTAAVTHKGWWEERVGYTQLL